MPALLADTFVVLEYDRGGKATLPASRMQVGVGTGGSCDLGVMDKEGVMEKGVGTALALNGEW